MDKETPETAQIGNRQSESKTHKNRFYGERRPK